LFYIVMFKVKDHFATLELFSQNWLVLYNSYNQEKSVPTQNLPIINNNEGKLSSTCVYIYIKANYTICHDCDRHVYQNATSET